MLVIGSHLELRLYMQSGALLDYAAAGGDQLCGRRLGAADFEAEQFKGPDILIFTEADISIGVRSGRQLVDLSEGCIHAA